MPKMTHPASKHLITVDASRAAVYESQGWTTMAATETPEKTDDKK